MTAVAGVVAPVPFLDLTATHDARRGDLDAIWTRVLDGGRFVGGPEVEAFERDFAAYCGAAHGVGVGNGTDALELILRGLGIGRGDEVVVPANTFVATVEAVLAVGAVPCFVDVLPDTLLIDPDAVRAALGPSTAAVIAVHLYGRPADVVTLRALTGASGVALVEDAAQAHGARLGAERVGGFGDAAAFSFYPGKNLGALGDGGAVVTSDPGLADRVRRTADHGRDPHHRERHDLCGRNSRLDALQAAVLRFKLGRLDTDNARRRAAWDRYLAWLPAHVAPLAAVPDAEAVHHLAVVQVDDRARATAALDAAGIGWGVHYAVPCHRQKPYAAFAVELPVVECAAERILSLPMFPTIAADQVARVCETLDGSGP